MARTTTAVEQYQIDRAAGLTNIFGDPVIDPNDVRSAVVAGTLMQLAQREGVAVEVAAVIADIPTVGR